MIPEGNDMDREPDYRSGKDWIGPPLSYKDPRVAGEKMDRAMLTAFEVENDWNEQRVCWLRGALWLAWDRLHDMELELAAQARAAARMLEGRKPAIGLGAVGDCLVPKAAINDDGITAAKLSGDTLRDKTAAKARVFSKFAKTPWLKVMCPRCLTVRNSGEPCRCPAEPNTGDSPPR